MFFLENKLKEKISDLVNAKEHYQPFIRKKTKKSKKNKKQKLNDFKGYASTYNVEVLNSFNPELLLKDTEALMKVSY